MPETAIGQVRLPGSVDSSERGMAHLRGLRGRASGEKAANQLFATQMQLSRGARQSVSGLADSASSDQLARATNKLTDDTRSALAMATGQASPAVPGNRSAMTATDLPELVDVDDQEGSVLPVAQSGANTLVVPTTQGLSVGVTTPVVDATVATVGADAGFEPLNDERVHGKPGWTSQFLHTPGSNQRSVIASTTELAPGAVKETGSADSTAAENATTVFTGTPAEPATALHNPVPGESAFTTTNLTTTTETARRVSAASDVASTKLPRVDTGLHVDSSVSSTKATSTLVTDVPMSTANSAEAVGTVPGAANHELAMAEASTLASGHRRRADEMPLTSAQAGVQGLPPSSAPMAVNPPATAVATRINESSLPDVTTSLDAAALTAAPRQAELERRQAIATPQELVEQGLAGKTALPANSVASLKNAQTGEFDAVDDSTALLAGALHESSNVPETASSNMFHATASGIVTAATSTRSEPTNATPLAPHLVPMMTARTDESLAENVRWMVGENIRTVTVNVTPSGMGPISINVVMESDQMNVSIVASQSATRDALDAAMPRLREHLQMQLNENVRVDVSDGRSGQPEQRSGKQADAQGTRPGGELIAEDEGQQSAQVTSMSTAFEPRGLIDAYA